MASSRHDVDNAPSSQATNVYDLTYPADTSLELLANLPIIAVAREADRT